MVLHLTLKKKWFDMIDSGEKKEEYRDLKSYWVVRLLTDFNWDAGKNPIKLNKGSYCGKSFNCIQFANGYNNPKKINMECNGIEIGEGKPEWGAERGKKYFVIKLGNKIKHI